MNGPLASASGEAICVPRGKEGNGKAFAAGRRGGCMHLDKPGIRNVYTAGWPRLIAAGPGPVTGGEEPAAKVRAAFCV